MIVATYMAQAVWASLVWPVKLPCGKDAMASTVKYCLLPVWWSILTLCTYLVAESLMGSSDEDVAVTSSSTTSMVTMFTATATMVAWVNPILRTTHRQKRSANRGDAQPSLSKETMNILSHNLDLLDVEDDMSKSMMEAWADNDAGPWPFEIIHNKVHKRDNIWV